MKMNTGIKKSIGFALCVMFAALTITACSGKDNEPSASASSPAAASTAPAQATETAQATESASASPVEQLPPITATSGLGIGFTGGTDGPFDDDVAKEIARITGVTLNNIPIGETAEARDNKLNIMLVSGEYPELLRVPDGDILQKYIKEQALLPLDDLIEQYGPNIKRMYGDTILKKLQDPDDGKIYRLTNWHGYTTDGGFFGMNIKRDLLQQLDPAIADSNNPITPERFYELLKAFKEKFPTIDGKPSIPLTFSIDQRFFDNNLGALGIFKAAYGIKEFSEDADHNLKTDIKDPRFGEVLKYLNKLQREKLIDSEWPTLKYQVYAQKLTQGNVFASTGAWFEPIAANAELSKNDPMSQYFAYVVAADGVANPPLYSNSETGKESISITKNAKDPVRLIKLLDFLASEDGNFLNFWGPQGGLWDVVDGKRTVKPELIAEYQQDPQTFWNTHNVRKWNIVNGQEPMLAEYTYADGTTFAPVAKTDTPYQQTFDWQMKSLISVVNTSYDGWLYEGIKPPAGSEEANIAQKFSDIKEKEVFKIIINSKSEDEVQAGLDNLIKQADGLGIEKYEQYITGKYKAKLSQLQ